MGVSMIVGGMTLKLDASEYGPLLAPSFAFCASNRCSRRPMAKAGDRACGRLHRAHVLVVMDELVKAVGGDVDSSEIARRPLVPAFSINSAGGSPLKMSFCPANGSSARGAVMLTPGMGPATDGAVGLALLAASHPTSTAGQRGQRALEWGRVWTFPDSLFTLPIPAARARHYRTELPSPQEKKTAH